MKNVLLRTLAPAVVASITVGLLGCSSGEFATSAEPATETGQAKVAVSQTDGDHTYTLVMTINAIDAGDNVVDSIVSDESSPAEQSLTLPLGEHSLEVEGATVGELLINDGSDTPPYCVYDGPRTDFVGCSFQGYDPDPLIVTAGTETEVDLLFTVHFVDEEIDIVFSSGSILVGVRISTSPDAGVSACGVPADGGTPAFGELCDPGEACTVVQDVEADTPRCYVECSTDDDCDEPGVPDGYTDCRVSDTLGGDGNGSTDGGLENPPMVCVPPIDNSEEE